MITADDVRNARERRGLASLFAKLGYETQLDEIDLAEWRKAGIGESLSSSARLFSFFATARVRALLLESASREEAADLCDSLSTRNKAIKTAIFLRCTNTSIFSIFSGSAARVLRLDVDLEQPRADTLDRLNALALDGERSLDLRSVFDAVLSREATGRKFFRLFRSAVRKVQSSLERQCTALPAELSRQSLLLMSRLLFLYFIQQKGWLDGRRRFLPENHARVAGRGNYFDLVLRPLFFDCLNTPVAARKPEARSLGRLPYLNGGLFEPSPFERRFPDATLPDELLEHVLEEVFEGFTISIDETDTTGVHIDPEMLGRVFESLMNEDERSGSGTFYTPKPIVEILTRRSISWWLADQDETYAREIARILSDDGEIDARLAAELLPKLEAIRVLDPACGSGAFLLAALYAIEHVITACHRALGTEPPASLRKSIVERSLFGVDLKSEAVRLCELRLWLAIVAVETSDIERVPPLPNLDRNILQGDSLLAPLDFLGGGRADIYREWSFALRARSNLISRYRSASPAEKPVITRALRDSDLALARTMLEKSIEADRASIAGAHSNGSLFAGDRRTAPRVDDLRERISSCERLLAGVASGDAGFFSYDLHFAEVMADGGFDLVLGNPPWIRASRIPPAQRRQYADRYATLRRGGSGFEQADLSIAFCEKSLSLLNGSGVAALLMPGKIANAGYAETLRGAISSRVVEFHDWSRKGSEFFDADVFPLGVLFAKRAAKGAPLLVDSDSASRDVQLARPRGREPWVLIGGGVSRLINAISSRHSTLQEVLARRPVMGVKTGANGRFFLPDLELTRGGARVGGIDAIIPADALARCVRGRDIRRWRSEASTWMLWPPVGRNGKAPKWLRDLAAGRGESVDEYRLSYIRPEHLGVKVVWKDLSKGLQAVVMPATVEVNGQEFRLVPNQTAYCLDAASLEEAYFLAAVLNSTTMGALAVSRAERAKDSHYRYFGSLIATLPLPEFTREQRDALIRLARRGHMGQSVEREIDVIVDDAYGLSGTERRLMAKHLAAALSQ